MNIAIVDQPKAMSIPEMLRRYSALVEQMSAMPGDLEDSPEGSALWNESQHINAQLALTPALTVQDLRAKVEWLKIPSNFNDGDFAKDSDNNRVLLSLFDDIEALETDQGIDKEQQAKNEFFNMSISDLAAAIRVWSRLYDQIEFEFSSHDINSPIGSHVEDGAHYIGTKCDQITEELIARCPGSEKDRNAKAWALLHRSNHIGVFDDVTRAAVADLELAGSQAEVAAQ